MWSNIVIEPSASLTNSSTKHDQPKNRFKHAVTLAQNKNELYLYGGKSGNLILKDFWCLHLRAGQWTEIKPNKNDNSFRDSDSWPPGLLEHTLVNYKSRLYLFGGEVGLRDENKTPLWIWDLNDKKWRKWNNENSGGQIPVGRRGHSASIWTNYMIIYGGFRELKGSLGDLWAFHFESESWHLFYRRPSTSGISFLRALTPTPLPRHYHSAIVHGQKFYIFGGNSNLEELGDFWQFSFNTLRWIQYKKKGKEMPGPLKGHCVSKALGSMFILGGERDGRLNDDFWKFDFTSETWEKLTFHLTGGPNSTTRPSPRLFPAVVILPAIVKIINTNNSNSNKISSSSRRKNSLEMNTYWWDDGDDQYKNLMQKANFGEYHTIDNPTETCIDEDEQFTPPKMCQRPTSLYKQLPQPNTSSRTGTTATRSESANFSGVKDSSQKDKMAIRKSNSVRFDLKNPHIHKSTSDYVSMELNSNCSNGIENQNYSFINSPADVLSQRGGGGGSGGDCPEESYEMASFTCNLDYSDDVGQLIIEGGEDESSNFNGNNGHHLHHQIVSPSTVIKENLYEISTPHYLILIGGQEKGNYFSNSPISLWRLRVSQEIFNQNNNNNLSYRG